MEVNIKHPTNLNIDFVIKIEDSIAATMTIKELLKNLEDTFIKINQTIYDFDYAKYWKLRSCKTGKYINSTSTCNEIATDDNKFTICWGTEKVGNANE